MVWRHTINYPLKENDIRVVVVPPNASKLHYYLSVGDRAGKHRTKSI